MGACMQVMGEKERVAGAVLARLREDWKARSFPAGKLLLNQTDSAPDRPLSLFFFHLNINHLLAELSIPALEGVR